MQSGQASGLYCAPFSLLGDICLDMPGMRGCEVYNSMCGTQGSVIAQCSTEGPVRTVLRTEEAMNAILDMCSTHSMLGCEECTARWAQCPDPLITISKLCLGMPGMPQCSRFFSMCSDASGTFTQICTAGGSSDALPPMKMYMHASMREIILFKEWVPESDGGYIAACLGVIVTAIVVQALKGLRVRTETKWALKGRTTCCAPNCPENEIEKPEQEPEAQHPCCGGGSGGMGAHSVSHSQGEGTSQGSPASGSLDLPTTRRATRFSNYNPETSLVSKQLAVVGFAVFIEI